MDGKKSGPQVRPTSARRPIPIASVLEDIKVTLYFGTAEQAKQFYDKTRKK